MSGLFDGPSVNLDDVRRLTRQLDRVKAVMLDGQWHTLAGLMRDAGGSEAGVSARLRDLRKRRNGSYVVERRRVAGADGLCKYRIAMPQPERSIA